MEVIKTNVVLQAVQLFAPGPWQIEQGGAHFSQILVLRLPYVPVVHDAESLQVLSDLSKNFPWIQLKQVTALEQV